jgi:GNAT superfamily N-acetyltransferase
VGNEATSIGALAFTHGSDVYFAPGQYQPNTANGLKLIGHELTHVVQQRAGRVKNPLGSAVAVVQDAALEAEADRMGTKASAPIQTKLATAPAAPRSAVPGPLLRPATVRPKSGTTASGHGRVQISAPAQADEGSYRIVAGVKGQLVGSVMLHTKGDSVIEVTDLNVVPSHRKQGLGGVLMASALRAGQRLGLSRVVLASQDSGSGRLTRWYRRMGFVQVGTNRLGYPELEAPIGRVVAGAAQARMIEQQGAAAPGEGIPALRGRPTGAALRARHDFVVKKSAQTHFRAIQMMKKSKYEKQQEKEKEQERQRGRGAEKKKENESVPEKERKQKEQKAKKEKAKKKVVEYFVNVGNEKVAAEDIVRAWELNHALFDRLAVADPAGLPPGTTAPTWGGGAPMFMDLTAGSAFEIQNSGLASSLDAAIQDSLNTPGADRGVHNNDEGKLPIYNAPNNDYNERSFLGGGARLVRDTTSIPIRVYISLHYGVFYRVR